MEKDAIPHGTELVLIFGELKALISLWLGTSLNGKLILKRLCG